MEAPIYGTCDRRLAAQRWYHGAIPRAEAAARVAHEGFLVREKVAHAWYVVMSSDVSIDVRRSVVTGFFEVTGLPMTFQSVVAAVRHLSEMGWVSVPAQRPGMSFQTNGRLAPS